MMQRNRKMAKNFPALLSVVLVVALTLVGVIPLQVSAAASGKTYYVATTGNNTNTGLSLSKPFRTIQKAVDKASAGDTIVIRGGAYYESIDIEVSGTNEKPITIKSYQEETPVIDGSKSDAETGICISSQEYIRIKGLSVCNFTSTDENAVVGIYVEGEGRGIEIRNCKVYQINTTYQGSTEDRNAHAIAVYGTETDPEKSIQSLVIDGNEVYSCRLGQSEAIVLNGNVDGFSVTNNKVHDCDNIGIDLIGYEGTANEEDEGDASANQDRARNGICSGNRIWNISCAKNPTYLDAGLCAGGLYVDGGTDIVIERNIINNCDIGIEIASEHYGCTSEDILVRNNLIKNCKGFGGIAFGGSDATENGTTKNLSILNNTLYGNSPSIVIQNANSETNVVKNNLLYSPGNVSVEGKLAKNQVVNNLTIDPKFTDVQKGDFTLKSGSPAIDQGVVESYGTIDLAGKPRVKGKAADCGAYEFQTL